MAGGYDGSVKIDTRIDSRGFNAGISGIVNSLKGVAAAVGIAFGVGAIVAFVKSSVDAASQLANAMTGLRSVLNAQGRSFTEAKSFIDSYVADGLIPATDAIATYKNLVARGFNTAEIEKLMLVFKDAAAFNRQSQFSIGEAVRKTSEGLRMENSLLTDSVGVQKNVAKMWEDYARSIGTSAQALTLAQKRQAEYNGFLEEARYFAGDAAKAAGTYSGKISALGVSFLNFQVAVGNTIIPILTQIIPYVKAVVDWLTVLFNTFAKFVQAFFGLDTSATVAAAEAAAANADAAQGAADAQGNLADQTKKAGKAAKGALAAFDELNVLQQDTSKDDKAPGGGAAGPVIPVPDAGGFEIPPEVLAQVEAFKIKLMELLGPAIEAFGRLRVALGNLGNTVWEGLKWGWDNILVPLGQWVVTEALPVFLDLLAAGASLLNAALLALAPMGLWLFENFLKPAAEWTGQALLDALQWLTDRLNELSTWINENPVAFQNIAIVIGILAGALLLAATATGIWAAITGVATAVTTAFGVAVAFLTSPVTLVILAIAALVLIIILLVKNWDWVKETAGKVWDWIVDKWEVAADWFKSKVIDPLVGYFKPFWNLLGILANNAWAVIKLLWATVSAWFQTNVTAPVTGWFKTAWENITGFFTAAWDKVVAIWGPIGEWITTNVTDPVQDAFKTALEWVGDKWEETFEGVQTFIKGSINAIIDLLNRLLSGAAAAVNGLIGSLNTLGAVVPGWISIPAVTAPQIPRLASGAVIPPNAEFLAMLGDQKSGTNIETPEALLRKIVREELGGGGDTNVTVPVYLDSEKIYQGQQRVSRRRGRSLLAGGTA
jgi:hypothetical protein